MEMPNRNASASVFGWQFQINVAIYLMIKYFKDFEEIKIEGKNEDIEISLDNKEKIYAQAKAKEHINNKDTSSYSSKLKKALDSLSDVKSKDVNKLIYISNLEPNPLNSGTNEFERVAFLKYDELLDESKSKIDYQLAELKKDLDKSKLIIAKIPFYGEDQITRKRYIIEEINDFLIYMQGNQGNLLPYSREFLRIWEDDFLHNATQTDQSIKIKKDDVLWNLIVFEIKDVCNTYDTGMKIDEEDYYHAIDKYDKVIANKEGNFTIYNKITALINSVKKENPNIRSNEFINEYRNKIYDIVFSNSKNDDEQLIEIACAKIVAKKIFVRNSSLDSMIRRVAEYEN